MIPASKETYYVGRSTNAQKNDPRKSLPVISTGWDKLRLSAVGLSVAPLVKALPPGRDRDDQPLWERQIET